MPDPQFVFLIGNKRSGTTHLVELLNLHPDVFVTHESDAMWILYQLTHRMNFHPYPWDGPVGMAATLESCHDILEDCRAGISEPGAVSALFLRIQRTLMERGSKVQKPYAKNNVQWIGDKKPVQQSNPEIFGFILRHFPAARFIHLIRHPRTVVASMLEAGTTWGQVGYWKNMTAEQILERWAIHEEWVLDAKTQSSDAVFSLRFEDLCTDSIPCMANVYGFLGLASNPQINSSIGQMTRPVDTEKYANFTLPPSDKANRIMEIYGYSH